MGAVENDRKHDDLCVWEPLILVPMAHKELASKHGMHRMLREDGSMQRNDLDTSTLPLASHSHAYDNPMVCTPPGFIPPFLTS